MISWFIVFFDVLGLLSSCGFVLVCIKVIWLLLIIMVLLFIFFNLVVILCVFCLVKCKFNVVGFLFVKGVLLIFGVWVFIWILMLVSNIFWYCDDEVRIREVINIFFMKLICCVFLVSSIMLYYYCVLYIVFYCRLKCNFVLIGRGWFYIMCVLCRKWNFFIWLNWLKVLWNVLIIGVWLCLKIWNDWVK